MYNVVVIGAGAGGLVVAIGCAKAGKKVLLIEKGTYGGDCTNFGCIPSKSLIASAHVAHAIRKASRWGIDCEVASLHTKGALQRTKNIVKGIREHEEPDALKKHGVDTLTGVASFVDPHTLDVLLFDGTSKTVQGKHIVIATGSHPVLPDISGLAECPYDTNETIFDVKEAPRKLCVIGAGPIGCELAQAFSRLGSEVCIIHHNMHILNKEELDAQNVLEKVFQEEGICLKNNCEPLEVTYKNSTFKIVYKNKTTGQQEMLEVDKLLVSSGRRPSIERLNLGAIGIEVNKRGIAVDAYGRTKHKNIWAVGDVVGHALFTHAAENQARSVLTNLLLGSFFKQKLDRAQAIGRVTYTDPEIASFGVSQEEAIELYGEKKIAVYTVRFSDLDRAITAGREEGFIKVITKKWSSKILGATIVAPRAGEMVSELTLAMREGIPLRKLASLIHPYPTYSLAIRKAADQWLSKTVLPFLMKFRSKK